MDALHMSIVVRIDTVVQRRIFYSDVSVENTSRRTNKKMDWIISRNWLAKN